MNNQLYTLIQIKLYSIANEDDFNYFNDMNHDFKKAIEFLHLPETTKIINCKATPYNYEGPNETPPQYSKTQLQGYHLDFEILTSTSSVEKAPDYYLKSDWLSPKFSQYLSDECLDIRRIISIFPDGEVMDIDGNDDRGRECLDNIPNTFWLDNLMTKADISTYKAILKHCTYQPLQQLIVEKQNQCNTMADTIKPGDLIWAQSPQFIIGQGALITSHVILNVFKAYIDGTERLVYKSPFAKDTWKLVAAV